MKSRSKYQQTSASERVDFVRMWLGGMSVPTIARVKNTSTSTVYRPRSSKHSYSSINARGSAMVVTSLVLLVAAGVCVGVAPLPPSYVKHSTTTSVVGVVEAVLATVANADYSVFLLTDGSTSASTVYTLVDRLRTPGGVGVFEVASEGQDINNMKSQFSHVISVIKQIRDESSHVTTVVISDDPAFLASFAQWSLKGRLLVWSMRLLVVTRLPLPELHHLHRAISKMNVMLVILNGDSAISRCNMYVHLPYSPRKAQALQVASWTPHQGLTLTSHLPVFPEKFSKFLIRPNLLVASQGNSLNKMITTEDPVAPRRHTFKFKGPIPNLMDYLANALNYSFKYVLPPDGTWGDELQNGSWTGMVGMTMRQEVDLCGGPFSITASRAKVVDFTVPIYIDYLRILGGRGRPEIDPWGFLLPLGPLVWTAILIVLLVLPGMVFFMSSLFTLKTDSQASWSHATFSYCRILLQQNILVSSDWWWQRVVLGVWMLMTLVLTRSYSGTLMSLLAVRHISEPFHSLRAVVDDPKVTMLWLKGTVFTRYLQTAESGIFREISDQEKKGRILWRSHSQFANDIDTWVMRGTHIFIGTSNSMKISKAKDYSETGKCSFYLSKEEFLSNNLAVIGQKNSPLVTALNKRIMSMTEAGLFFHWLESEEPNFTMCNRVPTKITVKTTLTLTNIWGMFVILATGHVVSLCVLCLELLSLRLQQGWTQETQ